MSIYVDLITINLYTCVFTRYSFHVPAAIVLEFSKISHEKAVAWWKYIPYMHHYNPQLVYFYPPFLKPISLFSRRFFRKFCPYVWLVFKKVLGYNGAHTVYEYMSACLLKQTNPVWSFSSEHLFGRSDSFPLMRKLAQDRFADKICKQVNLSIAR